MFWVEPRVAFDLLSQLWVNKHPGPFNLFHIETITTTRHLRLGLSVQNCSDAVTLRVFPDSLWTLQCGNTKPPAHKLKAAESILIKRPQNITQTSLHVVFPQRRHSSAAAPTKLPHSRLCLFVFFFSPPADHHNSGIMPPQTVILDGISALNAHNRA